MVVGRTAVCVSGGQLGGGREPATSCLLDNSLCRFCLGRRAARCPLRCAQQPTPAGVFAVSCSCAQPNAAAAAVEGKALHLASAWFAIAVAQSALPDHWQTLILYRRAQGCRRGRLPLVFTQNRKTGRPCVPCRHSAALLQGDAIAASM